VFLAAYNIPVSFHTVMRVVAGNSIANVTSATPGGAGVNQAFSVAALKGITSPQNATAYSIAQQLVTTAWNLLFAIVLMLWAFGWSGGQDLVTKAYSGAKEKQAERKAAHQAKKDAKRARKAEHSA
jgi:isocitrate dehydrogenase